MTWNDTAGSAILKRRQFEDVPRKNFLMHQQGLFSGKTVGDLDSVPGYYGGTASIRFVQNAHAIRNIKKTRVKYNLQQYGKVSAPFEKRLEAYRIAADLHKPATGRPMVVSAARGPSFKYAGQYGARYSPLQAQKIKTKLGAPVAPVAGAVVAPPVVPAQPPVVA